MTPQQSIDEGSDHSTINNNTIRSTISNPASSISDGGAGNNNTNNNKPIRKGIMRNSTKTTTVFNTIQDASCSSASSASSYSIPSGSSWGGKFRSDDDDDDDFDDNDDDEGDSSLFSFAEQRKRRQSRFGEAIAGGIRRIKKQPNPTITNDSNHNTSSHHHHHHTASTTFSNDITTSFHNRDSEHHHHRDSNATMRKSSNSQQNRNHRDSSAVFASTTNIFKTLRNETIHVMYSKRLVYLVIFVTAAILGTLTYSKLSQSETESFQDSYDAFTRQYMKLVHRELEQIVDSLDSVSREFTMLTLKDNMTWPFFTSPYFEKQSQLSRLMTKTMAQAILARVTLQQRKKYEKYIVDNQEWIGQALADTNKSSQPFGLYKSSFLDLTTTQQRRRLNAKKESTTKSNDTDTDKKYPFLPKNATIMRHEDISYGRLVYQDQIKDTYFAMRQNSPVALGILNVDLSSVPLVGRCINATLKKGGIVFSEAHFPPIMHPNGTLIPSPEPYSMIMSPIVKKFYPKTQLKPDPDDIVGIFSSLMPWRLLFASVYRTQNAYMGLVLVLVDPANSTFTFRVNGPMVDYIGLGDIHEAKYDNMRKMDIVRTIDVAGDDEDRLRGNYDYIFYLYPSSEMEESFHSNDPIIFASAVVGIFCFTAFVFAIYNWFVQRRQNKVMAALRTTSKVIASLFPANVLDRLMKDAEEEANSDDNNNNLTGLKLALTRTTQKAKLQNFLDDDDKGDYSHIIFKSKPIADLYPSATVMYADIAGFTAWSSVREPSQVFTLLETVFKRYDMIAKRRRIFKVETIGDCYVAVCGVPHPRTDHAVAMARFARDCIMAMSELGKKLEVELGPDTSDLGIRIGLHSGPVTAGILRGEKSRFQLFGDTVNMCAKMEHTGTPNKIHISQQTADQLVIAGKSSWIEKKHDAAFEDIETFWLALRPQAGSRNGESEHNSSDGNSNRPSDADLIEDESERNDAVPTERSDDPKLSPVVNKEEALAQSLANAKQQRLVDWNAEMLLRLLKQVIASRQIVADSNKNTHPKDFFAFRRGSYDMGAQYDAYSSADFYENLSETVIHEVVEIIDMPEFDARMSHDKIDSSTVEIDELVRGEVKSFVSRIASQYRDNPFHNFEHASHVTMSVTKLLSRIIAPDRILNYSSDEELSEEGSDKFRSSIASTLHDHTYGITSDPMTQFACVFSALIHDVDHPGVPNAQLVKENDSMAQRYSNQSVAEQNSVDIAWRLFMDKEYTAFRQALCPTPYDVKHFRQLVVNSVMATDIVDKDLKELRNNRWDVAFQVTISNESLRDQTNRKATIVIEHLIQASDVSHTMQHWHVYCKWNEMFSMRCIERISRVDRKRIHPNSGIKEKSVSLIFT